MGAKGGEQRREREAGGGVRGVRGEGHLLYLVVLWLCVAVCVVVVVRGQGADAAVSSAVGREGEEGGGKQARTTLLQWQGPGLAVG